MKEFNDIEIRAARSSLQILIENFIGKAKRILKFYDCPIVPKRATDAIYFLYEVGYFSDEEYGKFIKIIGFRNAMIHDYMEFDDDILIDVVKNRKYMVVYDFLIDDVKMDDVIIKRIKNFEI